MDLQRSEIAGMYKLLKGQPFEQDLFEVMLVSEPALVNRLTEVSERERRSGHLHRIGQAISLVYT